MSIQKNRLLAAAAVALGLSGIVALNTADVAWSCEGEKKASASVAKAEKSAEKATVAKASTAAKSSCASRSASATLASTKSATKSSCASKSASATLASTKSTTKSSCSSQSAETASHPVLITKMEYDQTKAPFALAAMMMAEESEEMGSCASSKKVSAALASSEESGCAYSKKASASLASADGGACHAEKSASASLALNEDGSCAAMAACADFAACSIKGDLASAKGAKRDAYDAEKASSGKAIENFKLPAFQAKTLAGETVSSKELVGQPTVLVMLAQHCGHSYQSREILANAAAEYEAKGVRVVGLMVGSSAETTQKWFDADKVNHEVWVTSDVSVADALEAHLVPTYVLIDSKGYVKTKLVGYQKQTKVNESISPLLVQADSGKEITKG